MIIKFYIGIQKNAAAENSISYHHMFVVVCYQKICQLGSKEHLHAFSDCKEDKLKKRGRRK